MSGQTWGYEPLGPSPPGGIILNMCFPLHKLFVEPTEASIKSSWHSGREQTDGYTKAG